MKYQTKISNAEDNFKIKLKDKEREYEERITRKDGVGTFRSFN